MIKRLMIIVLSLGLSLITWAEETKPVEAAKGTLKGYVFDESVNQPLEYATVSLVRKKDNQVVNGTITDQTGFFKLKNVDFGMYKVDITFIGYKTKSFENVAIKPDSREVDLGRVQLASAVEEIDEAVVVADRPTMTYKIDKKVINVSQQHTSASGTAVEILETIPSVTVDIEGNVSLRGSQSFTVLIDGKPTVLEPSDALSQIPASAIENIEVITNPSAKYDPDGTSGIINIITKKNKLQGFNGILNLNAGMYERYGGDFLLNFRKEKFNFYVGADLNNRGMFGSRESENRTITRNPLGDTTSYILSDGDFNRGGLSYSIRGGFDYNLNARNSISLEARYGDRNWSSDNTVNFNEFTDPVTTNNTYTSDEFSERGGSYYSLNLSYTHKFMKKGHELYSLINYSNRDFEEESVNELIDNNNLIVFGQRAVESGPSQPLRYQLDYTLPLRTKDRFEAGYQARFSDNDEIAELYLYNPVSEQYEFDNTYSNNSNYKRSIHSLYSTYSGELGDFGYQGGLRAEYTYRDITVQQANLDPESFTIDRWDLFPTVHMSYNIPKDQQLMASYTRRIERPRGWYLEPFITWSDAYNVRQGNPGLQPEYIDSYELSYLNKFEKNSLSIEAYYRITNNKIERIRSVYDDNVFLSTFANVGKDYSLGIETMFGVDPFKWWHLDLMGNIYDYRVEGELLGRDFSTSSFNWSARFNNTIKLGKSTRVQLNGMYNSPTITAQGERDGFFMTNLAVRQSFLKNQLAATVQVRDLFGTMKHSSTYSDDDFYSYSYFSPNTPVVTFTLTYRINNYRQDRGRRNSGDDMDDMGGEDEGF